MASGGWNTGTALEITSIPVIAVAPEANARSNEQHAERLGRLVRRRGHGMKAVRAGLDQTADHDQRDCGHEQVGGGGEGGGGIAHPAQVAGDEEPDHRQPIGTVSEDIEGIAEVTRRSRRRSNGDGEE